MPVRFPTDTFFQSSGNAAAEFTEAVRDGVATFACGLWSNFPGFITNGINPANSFARGFMNRACAPIQPPVNAPATPFTGGQCIGVSYRVTATVFQDFGGGTTNTTGLVNQPVSGAIIFVEITPREDDPTKLRLEIRSRDILGNILINGQNLSDSVIAANVVSVAILRLDGQADDCGNPPVQYPSPEPVADDLNTVTNININDGLDLNLEIQYIKSSNQYNFPMFFKVNGINVSLDIGGITIHAPDGFGSPSGDNDLPPPGSDPGTDGIGNPITKTYPDSEYPVAPDADVPRTVAQIIQYLACVDGVIETVEVTLSLIVGSNPLFLLVIQILGEILTDICEEPEANVGLPEYFGVQPGADRPAIVYLWKTFENGKWGASTYSSTVHHPTAQAIDNIQNLQTQTKSIGIYKTFARLTDSSVITATGGTEIASIGNFNFLISQVDPFYLPADLNTATITQTDNRLTSRNLRLRQVEYYPTGKKNNDNPSIKRIIPPPMP